MIRAAGPGVARLLASSIVARLPEAMLGIALLVHVHRLTGSFAVAGVASGAYAIACGVGAPLLGRLVDRCGQTIVLLCTAIATASLLAVIAMLPSSVPAAAPIALAAAIGLVNPPVGACVRTLLPVLVSDPAALPAAYTFETAALELTFIFGPPLALGLAALWSTSAALAMGGAVELIATVAFAAHPASRNWRPTRRVASRRGGSLRAPAMWTLVLILASLGAVFGAVEVAVTADASALGATAAAGPLLGIWGLGSLLGGFMATRLGGAARRARDLILLVAALAVGHAVLLATPGNLPAIGAVLLVAGAWIAPTEASIYAIAGRSAPAGNVTEAFAWLLTASSTGASLGVAAAGALTQGAGPEAAFALAGAAGTLAVIVAVLGKRTIETPAAAPARSLQPAVA